MGVHTFLVPCRFLTMLGHFLAALLVFFSYVCRPFPSSARPAAHPAPPPAGSGITSSSRCASSIPTPSTTTQASPPTRRCGFALQPQPQPRPRPDPDPWACPAQVLHAWRRELYELLPYLRATEVKCGWLYKRGETSSAGFKKRYCVLFSSYRLLYFDSEACTKRKGAVDLSIMEAVDDSILLDERDVINSVAF